jgi:hypothetical protein
LPSGIHSRWHTIDVWWSFYQMQRWLPAAHRIKVRLHLRICKQQQDLQQFFSTAGAMTAALCALYMCGTKLLLQEEQHSSSGHSLCLHDQPQHSAEPVHQCYCSRPTRWHCRDQVHALSSKRT